MAAISKLAPLEMGTKNYFPGMCMRFFIIFIEFSDCHYSEGKPTLSLSLVHYQVLFCLCVETYAADAVATKGNVVVLQ